VQGAAGLRWLPARLRQLDGLGWAPGGIPAMLQQFDSLGWSPARVFINLLSLSEGQQLMTGLGLTSDVPCSPT
jgi:hypothetical protein